MQIGNQRNPFIKPAYKETIVGSITYYGFADPGSSESDAVWQCIKIDQTSGGRMTYADGNNNYDNIATDLTALTYS